jgi:peroxin-2
VSPDNTVAREVSFEFLNRQLVWHAFTEFLLFILPILRVGKWRRWWARFTRKINTSIATEGPEGTAKNGELGFLPGKTCAICYKEQNKPGDVGGSGGIASTVTDVTNPYETVECGCVYCYVCIATKIQLEEGEGWECLRCGTTCKKCRPWTKGGAKAGDAVGEFGSDGEESEDEDGTVRKAGEGESEVSDEDYDRLRQSELREVSPKPYSSQATSEANTVVRDDDSASDTTERGAWHARASSGTGSTGRQWEEESESDVYATANASEVESDDEEVRRIF